VIRDNRKDMKRNKAAGNRKLRVAIKRTEEELRIGAKILEWEIGDIWGHVGARLLGDNGIAVQMFRPPEQGNKNWLVRFDHSLYHTQRTESWYDLE
jgi:hypothetical protein